MKKRVIIIIPLVILIILPVLGYISLYIYDRLNNPQGYCNLKICKDIPVGTQLPELKRLLGNPVHSYMVGEDTWICFNAPFLHSFNLTGYPIEARVKAHKVVELRCEKDGPSTWTLSE